MSTTIAEPGITSARILRYSKSNKPLWRDDTVVTEEPLEIRVRGRSIAVTMRTPGHDDELATGFLYSEAIVREHRDVTTLGLCLQAEFPQNTLNVFLAPKIRIDFKRLTRHVFASSSCGLCGKASIESVQQHFPPIDSRLRVPRRVLYQIPMSMLRAQSAFSQTGGLHAAAIFDSRGKLVVLREDVGRHNAVDKVIGHGLLADKLPFNSHVLLVSGRASFEIMQKALAARIPIVCAISAPSSLAVEFARENRQTLAGFLRGETMNIYSEPDRIT